MTPVEARKKVGEKITVEMTVRAAKDRLEKRGEIYLDSETNFRDEKNFAVVITKAGAASLAAAGIADPAGHFLDKTIRATGTVKEVEKIAHRGGQRAADQAGEVGWSEPWGRFSTRPCPAG